MSDAHCSTDELGLPGAGNAAIGGSARAVNTAQRGCPAERLPPEVLCAAFTYLSLHDRIRASHVSRYWRAAALGSPQLWATVNMTCSSISNVNMATMVISRSGSIADVRIVSFYPVLYLDFAAAIRGDREGDSNPDPPHSFEDEAKTDFETVILPYLHKIRSLKWNSHVPVRSICQTAPFLEQLHVGPRLDIQADFLGGSGRLRTLHCEVTRLPLVCPALSFVTDLRIDDVQIDLAAGVPRVFDLCPRLESLILGGLINEHSRQLLSGPPPTSLRALTLKSKDPEWDLTQHFVDLHTADLRLFSIDIAASKRTTLGRLPDQLLRDAAGLHIREPYDANGSWFIVTLPDAREYSVALPVICVPELVEHIIASGATMLGSIRTLDVTINLVERFVAVAHALPALETVTIHLETYEGSLSGPGRHPDTEIVGWDALEHLQAVLDAAPRLRALVLAAHASWDAKVNDRDAEFILSYLEFLDGRTGSVPEITVRGFTAETVRDVQLEGLPVRFDTAESGDGSAYWPFQVAYDDS